MHPGIQIGGTIPQQDLKDAHGVGSHGGVQRCPSGVVLTVGIGTGVQQPFGGIRPSESGRQMQRCLARFVHGGVQFGALGQQIGYNLGGAVVIVLDILPGVQTAAMGGGYHQGCQAARTSGVHVVLAILVGRRRHNRPDIRHIEMGLGPDPLIGLLVLGHHGVVAGIATVVAQTHHRYGIAALSLRQRHIRFIVRPMGTGLAHTLRLEADLLVQVAHLLAVRIPATTRHHRSWGPESFREPGDTVRPLPLRTEDHAEERQDDDDQNDARYHVLDVRRRLTQILVARILNTPDTVYGKVVEELMLGRSGGQELGRLHGVREALGALAIIDLECDLDARLVDLVRVDDLVLACKIRILDIRHPHRIPPIEDHVLAHGVLL